MHTEIHIPSKKNIDYLILVFQDKKNNSIAAVFDSEFNQSQDRHCDVLAR